MGVGDVEVNVTGACDDGDAEGNVGCSEGVAVTTDWTTLIPVNEIAVSVPRIPDTDVVQSVFSVLKLKVKGYTPAVVMAVKNEYRTQSSDCNSEVVTVASFSVAVIVCPTL